MCARSASFGVLAVVVFALAVLLLALMAKILRMQTVLLQQHLQMRPVHVDPSRQFGHRAANLMQAAFEERLFGFVAGSPLGIRKRQQVRYVRASYPCTTRVTGAALHA